MKPGVMVRSGNGLSSCHGMSRAEEIQSLSRRELVGAGERQQLIGNGAVGDPIAAQDLPADVLSKAKQLFSVGGLEHRDRPVRVERFAGVVDWYHGFSSRTPEASWEMSAAKLLTRKGKRRHRPRPSPEEPAYGL